jgi:hypothetical protein
MPRTKMSTGHHQIEQDNVYRLLVKLFDSLVAVGRADHLKSFRLDHTAERVKRREIIINEEDPGIVTAVARQAPAGAGTPAGADVLRYQACPAL